MPGKRINLSEILQKVKEINITQSGILVLETLESCYKKLCENLEVSYTERYKNQDEGFDDICRDLEKDIRMVEHLIWTIHQSQISKYINNEYDHNFATNVPYLDFKALYSNIMPEDIDDED